MKLSYFILISYFFHAQAERTYPIHGRLKRDPQGPAQSSPLFPPTPPQTPDQVFQPIPSHLSTVSPLELPPPVVPESPASVSPDSGSENPPQPKESPPPEPFRNADFRKYSRFLDQELERVVNMLEMTEKRLATLYAYLNQKEVPALTFMSVKLASTFRTWSSIMRPRLPVRGSPKEPDRQSSLQQIAQVLDLATYMVEQLLGQNREDKYGGTSNFGIPQVEFHYSDLWLEDKSKTGVDQPSLDQFWDSRSVTRADEKRKTWIQIPGGRLEEGDHRMAVRLLDMVGRTPTVLALNHYYMEDWIGMERKSNNKSFNYVLNRLGTMTAAQKDRTGAYLMLKSHGARNGKPERKPNQLNKDEQIQLTAMVKGHLATVILYEFTQLQVMIPRSFSSNGRLAFDYDEKLTAWEAVTKRAKDNPQIAQQSADNFVYLIFALYLDTFDWSTGSNRRIARARQD